MRRPSRARLAGETGALVLLVTAAFLAVACSISDVPLGNRGCPCVNAQWTCLDGVCVASSDAFSPADAAPEGDGSPGGAAFTVSDLTSLWVTSETIRWGWTTGGDASQFAGFALILGDSNDDVVNETGTAHRITQATNLELGVALLPHSGSGDPVLWTSTTDLLPSHTYYARLLANDTSGRVSSTAVASTTTAVEATSSLVLFGDTVPPAATYLPCDLAPECSDGGAGGQGCFMDYASVCSADASCGDVAADCYGNLTERGLSLSLRNVNPNTAFLEFQIELSGWTAGYTRLQVAVDTSWFGFDHLSLGNGGYRLVQVPLHALQGTFNYAGTLAEFQLGGTWPPGSHARIAQVRVRW